MTEHRDDGLGDLRVGGWLPYPPDRAPGSPDDDDADGAGVPPAQQPPGGTPPDHERPAAAGARFGAAGSRKEPSAGTDPVDVPPFADLWSSPGTTDVTGTPFDAFGTHGGDADAHHADPDGMRPDPDSTRPDPFGTRPDPDSTRPDPFGTRPDPDSTRPDPLGTRPDTGVTRPETAPPRFLDPSAARRGGYAPPDLAARAGGHAGPPSGAGYGAGRPTAGAPPVGGSIGRPTAGGPTDGAPTGRPTAGAPPVGDPTGRPTAGAPIPGGRIAGGSDDNRYGAGNLPDPLTVPPHRDAAEAGRHHAGGPGAALTAPGGAAGTALARAGGRATDAPPGHTGGQVSRASAPAGRRRSTPGANDITQQLRMIPAAIAELPPVTLRGLPMFLAAVMALGAIAILVTMNMPSGKPAAPVPRATSTPTLGMPSIAPVLPVTPTGPAASAQATATSPSAAPSRSAPRRTTSPTPARVLLGALGFTEMSGYCQSQQAGGARLSKPAQGPGAAIDNWVCTGVKRNKGFTIVPTSVCRWRYGGSAYAAYLNINDAYSWRCYR